MYSVDLPKIWENLKLRLIKPNHLVNSLFGLLQPLGSWRAFERLQLEAFKTFCHQKSHLKIPFHAILFGRRMRVSKFYAVDALIKRLIHIFINFHAFSCFLLKLFILCWRFYFTGFSAKTVVSQFVSLHWRVSNSLRFPGRYLSGAH